MKIIRGFIVCFSLYSVIPMPKTKWDDNSIKYAFCFLPIIGLITGIISIFWYKLSLYLNINILLYAAVASVIDVIISGAIHIDGFIDSLDAIFSCKEKEKKLLILKDSHIGAFALIYTTIYFLITLGIFSEIYTRNINIYALILPYTLARVLGAYSTVAIKPARNEGLAYTFYSMSDRNLIKIIFTLYALIIVLSFFVLFKSALSIIIFAFLIIYFFSFKKFSLKEFGGFTGDLAGFQITTFELIALVIIIFVN